jgi:hypothetical protein
VDLQLAAAVFAHGAEVVGDVDHQLGAELAADVEEFGQVRSVGVHGEDALGDDEDGVLGVGGADAGEVAADGVVVEVAEELHGGSAGGGALAQRVVGELVEEDVVAAVHQRADGAEARGPTGGEERYVVGVQGFGEPRLQRLADGVGVPKGGGARGDRAVVAQGLVGGVEDGGVAGEGKESWPPKLGLWVTTAVSETAVSRVVRAVS